VNRYDGLNLPQLMELMHGLVVPEPVPWLPSTPGWWVLAGWLVAVALLGAGRLALRRRRNRYRREAAAELDTIEAQADGDPAAAAAQISILLKRTALAAYSRDRVAALHGAAWARFLEESADGDPVVAAAAERFASAAYRPDADGRELVAPARRWIRVHRA
jgi:hypothetical protein